MPGYDDLTPAEQATVDACMLLVRPTGGMFAKSAAKAKLIAQDSVVSGAAALIAGLDGTIPNKTNLAGALPMSAADCQTMLAQLDAIASTYGTDANTELYIRAAGVNAIL